MSVTYLYGETISHNLTGTPEYRSFLFWVCLAHFFGNVSYYYFAFLRNSEKAKSFSLYTVAGSLVNTLLALFLVVYLRVGIIGIVYAQLCSGVLICVLLAHHFALSYPFSLNIKIFLEALKIAYPLTPRVFFGVLGKQFDKYMIGLLVSVGGVGIYSIGQKVSYTVFTYMTAIENVFSPHVYQKMFDLDEKQGGRAVGKYITPYAYASIALAIVVALFSEELVFLLTPSAYYAAIDIISVLTLYYGFLFWGKLNSLQLIYKKKTHITSILTILNIGLNIVLNIPFILKWGAVGAAWATVLAGMISGAITFCVAQSVYAIKWEYGSVALIFGTFFVSSVLLIVLRNMQVAYLVLLGIKLSFLLIYGGIGMWVGVITTENFSLARKILLGLLFRKVHQGAALP